MISMNAAIVYQNPQFNLTQNVGMKVKFELK